jgi:hypothetical protein
MLRHAILSACFVGTVGAFLFMTACPPAAHTGEGEGEGGGGEGEGEGEGGGEGEGASACGAVTETGDCNGKNAAGQSNGNVVEFCDTTNNKVVTIDCGSTPFAGAQCATVSQDWGVDCTVQSGTCFFPDPTGANIASSAFCAGDTTAQCVVTSATTSACTTGSTQCTQADDDQCNGTVYTRCNFALDATSTDGQRTTLDCSVLGGTCATAGGDPNLTIFGGCYSGKCERCAPNIGWCGTGPADQLAVLCPANGICPPNTDVGEGEGEGEGASCPAGEGEGEGAAGEGEGEGAAGEGEGEGGQ